MKYIWQLRRGRGKKALSDPCGHGWLPDGSRPTSLPDWLRGSQGLTISVGAADTIDDADDM